MNWTKVLTTIRIMQMKIIKTETKLKANEIDCLELIAGSGVQCSEAGVSGCAQVPGLHPQQHSKENDRKKP